MVGADLLAATIEASRADNEADAGDPETALRLMTDALKAYRETDGVTARWIATTVANITQFLVVLGRYDSARTRATEALQLARDQGLEVVATFSFQYLVVVAVVSSQAERKEVAERAGVSQLCGFVDARFATLRIPQRLVYQRNTPTH